MRQASLSRSGLVLILRRLATSLGLRQQAAGQHPALAHLQHQQLIVHMEVYHQQQRFKAAQNLPIKFLLIILPGLNQLLRSLLLI